MKTHTIKKSKKTIEKEREAMILLEDAVKLFYVKRYLSANTLASVAVKHLGKIADMKAHADNQSISFGFGFPFEKKYVEVKGKKLSNELNDEKILIFKVITGISLAVVCYQQINNTLPPDKTILKFCNQYMKK